MEKKSQKAEQRKSSFMLFFWNKKKLPSSLVVHVAELRETYSANGWKLPTRVRITEADFAVSV